MYTHIFTHTHAEAHKGEAGSGTRDRLLALKIPVRGRYTCVAVCCSVSQCVAVCGSVSHCVAVCCSVSQCVAVIVEQNIYLR